MLLYCLLGSTVRYGPNQTLPWHCGESLCRLALDQLKHCKGESVEMLVHLLVLSVLYLSWKKGRGKRSLSCPNPKKAAWSSPSASAAPHFAGRRSLAQPLCCGRCYAELRLQEAHTWRLTAPILFRGSFVPSCCCVLTFLG